MMKPIDNLVLALQLDRRQAFSLAGATAAISMLPSGVTTAQACNRIVVGTWGGDFGKAIESSIGAALRKANGAEFVADVGAAGARKTRLMAERERVAGSTDVVCLDSFDMYQMSMQDLLLMPDMAAVPNIANISPGFARPYSVPQAFSAKVIVYNPEKMKAPKSYRDLWSSAYAGKIGLADLLALGIIESAAQIAGGGPTNYEPGKDKLLELKASGVKLYPSNEALAAAFSAGDVWATIMWRARAHQWKRSGLPVAHAVPEEGATPITFEVAAPRNAPNKQCAMAFLNQALDPIAQAGFAEQIGYMPTVANARLEPAVASELDFRAEDRANFFKQDFDYLLKNQTQLLDWWTRTFKA